MTEDIDLKISDKVQSGLKEVLAVIKARGLEQMIVSFSGSGDDGSIHSYIDAEGNDIVPEKTWDDTFYYLLETTGIDWYNNDGGQGTITIQADGNVEMSVGQNYIQVEDNYFTLKVEG